jgi:3-oxoacyl-[acyl-carrier protein] reductase
MSDTPRPPSAHAALELGDVSPDVVDAYHLDRLPFDRPLRSTADLLRLDGQVALVTGGGGSGLGNAICHRLAEQGAAVAVMDVDEAVASAAADELHATWDVETAAVVGNVADWDSAFDAVGQATDRLGPIDLLVNNAGGSGSIGASGDRVTRHFTFTAMDRRDIEITVGVNLLGVIHMTRAVLDVMIPRGRGRILNIASEGAKVGGPDVPVYSGCKAAVVALTRNLAHELGPQGITIAAVCPAIMVSDRLLRGGTLSPDLAGPLGWSFKRTTIGRVSMPDEVASMVAFLASEAGSYVHGTAISVGGGFSD